MALWLPTWMTNDEIRTSERAGDFGLRFIERDRSVYNNNDQQAALKRGIKVRLGAAIIEEMS